MRELEVWLCDSMWHRNLRGRRHRKCSALEGKEVGKAGVLNAEKRSPTVDEKGVRRALLVEEPGRCGGQ